MTAYALYILDLNSITTPEEHLKATRQPPQLWFDKLRDIEARYDIKLRRERVGYSTIKGNTEYIAHKVCLPRR